MSRSNDETAKLERKIKLRIRYLNKLLMRRYVADSALRKAKQKIEAFLAKIKKQHKPK